MTVREVTCPLGHKFVIGSDVSDPDRQPAGMVSLDNRCDYRATYPSGWAKQDAGKVVRVRGLFLHEGYGSIWRNEKLGDKVYEAFDFDHIELLVCPTCGIAFREKPIDPVKIDRGV
jgi:hypothetical protein